MIKLGLPISFLLLTVSTLYSGDLEEFDKRHEDDISIAQDQQIVSEETIPKEQNISEEQTIESDTSDSIDQQEDIILTDTVLNESATDTTETITPDSTSIINDSSKSLTDTTIKEEMIDTVKSWRKRSFNIGIGWEIGKEPLFIKWNDFNDNILDLYKNALDDDTTLNIRSKIIEDPPEYNVTFPMRLSFSLPEKSGYRVTPFLTYAAIKRKYASRISDLTVDTVDGEPTDNLMEIWHCSRKQTLRELSLGLRVSRFISEKYFIINGVEDVTINIGVSISPLVALSSKTKLKGTAISDMSHDFKAFGLGANWEAGLSTYKTTPGGNGMEVGLSYHGSWRGQFIKNGYISGTSVTNNDISGSLKVDQTEIGYLTHKLLIFVDLILTKREGKRNLPLEYEAPAVVEEDPDGNQDQ